MSNLISLARSIALESHKGQKYGLQPYSIHLEAVDAVLCGFGYEDHEELRAAAWLHDTDYTLWMLIGVGIPIYVVALVDAVTNQPGVNRAAKHVLTYPRIARIPDAVTLKLADRLANVRASVTDRPDLLKMYAREHAEFIKAMPFKERDEDMRRELRSLIKVEAREEYVQGFAGENMV